MDFGHDAPDRNAATAILIGSEQTRRLYHTIASMVQDVEVYFAALYYSYLDPCRVLVRWTR
jgi:hypothetical protein